jgi:hypothetical protein
MKEKLSKLIDLKSIITILLVLTLVILVITFAIKTGTIEEKLFLLFSNVTTMVITYFFTKKTNVTNNEKSEENDGV